MIINKTKIFFSSLLVISSFNVNAKELLIGAVIKEHHSWTTGEVIKAGIKESITPYVSSTTSAYAGSVSGHVHQNIGLSGSHSYSIKNDGKSIENCTVVVTLCTSKEDCFYDVTTYSIYPNGSVYNSALSFLTTLFSSTGSYTITAETNVSGASNSHAKANGYVTIQT